MQTKFLILLGTGLTLFGCGTSTTPTADDSTNTDVVTNLNAAVGQSIGGSSRFVSDTSAERTACSAIGSGACSAGVKARVLSTSSGDTGGCTRGTQTVFGEEDFTFSATPACTFAAGSTITRTTKNHYYTEASGRKMLELYGARHRSDETVRRG